MSTNRILPMGLAALFCLGLSAGPARGEEGLWTSDFAAAKAKAKAEKKYLLVDFTGSDWCIWCKRLHAEVFDKDTFKTAAPKQFVPVELDFPRRTKLSVEVEAQNAKLAKEFRITGYPTVLVLDAEGKLIARTGYKPGGPEKYMTQLGEFSTIYDTILKMRSELKGVKGLDRAKLLDQLIVAYDKLKNPVDDLPAWCKEIVALDADNGAGLRQKYECRMMLAEADQLARARKLTEAIAVLEKGLAISGLTDEQKQNIYFKQGSFHMGQKDLAATVACFNKALETAPRSVTAQQIKLMLKSLGSALEAQEFIAKNLDAAEKAAGMERAKLLDQLIDANAKLLPFGGSKIEAAKIAAWRVEIPKLDDDNTAGLKTKYQFAATLREAGELAREKKFDEAQAALDKVLAVSGIGAEQLQQGWFYKGMFYQQAKNAAMAVECYQKALDAAPEGRAAATIRLFLQQAQKSQKPAAAAKKAEAKTEG